MGNSLLLGNKKYEEQVDEKATDNSETTQLVDQKDQKRKFDPTFNGPIHHRSCTDVVCCIIFCAYMIGMLVVGGIGIYQGQPKRLLYPTDSNGKICGIDIKDKPYLYFFDLTKCITKGTSDPFAYVKHGFTCPTPQVCVSKCPTKSALGDHEASQDMICQGAVKANLSPAEKKALVSDGTCAPYYVKSKEVFRRCIPKELAKVFDTLKVKTSDNENVTFKEVSTGMKAIGILLDLQATGIQIVSELQSVWYWLLIALILTMVVSIIYIILARWITYPLVIFTQIGIIVLLVYGTYYAFKTYKVLVDTKTSKEIKSVTDISSFMENKTSWLILGLVLAAVLLILLLIMIFMLSKIRLACGLIAEASRALTSMLSALFFPILPWILQLAWFAWFAVILAFLMSNGVKQYRVSQNDTTHNLTLGAVCDPASFNSSYLNTKASCLFSDYVKNKNLLVMQIFHLFGWLWGANFLIAFAECSLAGAFASYYFAFHKPKDIPSMPVFTSMWRALSYHCGSLAFGAAIIAIVQLIRMLLEYIHQKLKDNTDNPVADFLMKCLKCCFWCLEKCLRFINKNAYIMIAIYGKNFCVSAKDAIFLLGRNITSTVAINGVTGFILLLGKLLVSFGVGAASFYWFSRPNPLMTKELEYSMAPVIICTIAAYLVTRLFFSVYDMGIDTLFLCYLEDVERHDGSPEKPYYMTPQLQDIMHKHNTTTAARDNPGPPVELAEKETS